MREPLVFLTAVLALGIAAQWLAWRLGLPSILLLLLFGFGAGFLTGVNPEDFLGDETLFAIVSLSVAVILFEGGLSLELHELRQSGALVLRLVTLGVLVAWAMTAIVAWLCVEMDPRIAALTGAILVVTGPTVIAPLLRHVRPSRPVGSIVKWEGIVVDPIGAVLAVLVFQAVLAIDAGAMAVQPAKLTWLLSCSGILVRTIFTAGLAAVATAVLLVQLLRRYWLPDFLHTFAFLAAAVCSFTVSNVVQAESGLLTVTVLGIILANQKSVPIRHVAEFKENLRVLLISCLFILLASRLEPNDLRRLGWSGVVFLVALIVLVRPLSVVISTLGAKLGWRERTFLAFLAPRGIVAAAVASVFELEILKTAKEAGVNAPPGTEAIVPLTFLVIVGTVAFYGLVAAPLARLLRLSAANPQGVLFAGAAQWTRMVAGALQDEGYPVLLVDTNYYNTSAARMKGLPVHCASILSEYVEEEIDLTGIGRLLAATPNDDLNTLAAAEFTQIFGRAEVYQLSPGASGAGRRDSKSPHLRGRPLFDPDATYTQFAFRVQRGAQIKRTKITTEFTYQDFRQLYGDTALLLFVKQENGNLTVSTADVPADPKPGQTVIAIVEADSGSQASD